MQKKQNVIKLFNAMPPLGTSLSQFSTVSTLSGEIQVIVYTYLLIPCFLYLSICVITTFSFPSSYLIIICLKSFC